MSACRIKGELMDKREIYWPNLNAILFAKYRILTYFFLFVIIVRIVRRLRMSLELTTFTLAFLICQRVSAIIMIFMMVELNGG